MTRRFRVALALASAMCVAGCATPPFTTPSAVVTSPRKKVVPPARVKDAVAIGRSTRADVIAALGETLVIRFDTGFEVWVYGLANAPGAEFVILFSPSGVVTKTRVRPSTRSNA